MRVTVTLHNSRTSDEVVLGPFEFVQFTYLLVRDDHDNALVVYNERTGWWTLPDGRQFSDIVISVES